VIPGLILAGFYIATIWLQTRLDPDAAPAYEVPPIPLSRSSGCCCATWCRWSG
jgi:TRAP-type mannitol/chloroaromatic compound transport system permease large subunit